MHAYVHMYTINHSSIIFLWSSRPHCYCKLQCCELCNKIETGSPKGKNLHKSVNKIFIYLWHCVLYTPVLLVIVPSSLSGNLLVIKVLKYTALTVWDLKTKEWLSNFRLDIFCIERCHVKFKKTSISKLVTS